MLYVYCGKIRSNTGCWGCNLEDKVIFKDYVMLIWSQAVWGCPVDLACCFFHATGGKGMSFLMLSKACIPVFSISYLLWVIYRAVEEMPWTFLK